MARGMYWTCEFGSNHDHGERCDCLENQIAENKAAQRYMSMLRQESGGNGLVMREGGKQHAKVC